ncbi:MAG: 4-(cytidine 5'-diphospho)-2-C-methyl-D-erythritol kinase [Nocardioides sp.]
MAESVTVRAPAKVNLHLGVAGVRADGFHPLGTVFQAVSLYDDVTVIESEDWSVELLEPDPEVPLDGTNLAVRAGQALVAHHGLDRAAHIEIHKGIPVAGGMAGGSADAAATLVALDRLWSLETTDDDLLGLAGRLGSDVPFALLGGTAVGTGRGEIVEPVRSACDLWWTVVPDGAGLPTPTVFASYDALAQDPDGLVVFGDQTPSDLLAALAAGDAQAVIAALHNDLTVPAYVLRPELAQRARRLTELTGAGVLLSGSGPTQLLAHVDAEGARGAAAALVEAGIAHTTAHGPVAGVHVVSYG